MLLFAVLGIQADIVCIHALISERTVRKDEFSLSHTPLCCVPGWLQLAFSQVCKEEAVGLGTLTLAAACRMLSLDHVRRKSPDLSSSS